MKYLQEKWQRICNTYLQVFCKRHGYQFDPTDWVGIGEENIGTIVEVNDMYLHMDDIRYDVDNQVPIDYISRWYYKRNELHELGVNYMNFPSFCKGAPDPWTKEKIDELHQVQDKVLCVRNNIERMISETITQTIKL